MQFSNIVIVAASMASVALAQTNGPNAFTSVGGSTSEFKCEANKPCDLEWTADTGKQVTIVLQEGSSNNMQTVGKPLAENINNSGKTTIQMPDLRGPYAIRICAGDACNYTPPFTLDGSGKADTASDSAAPTASADATASADESASATDDATVTETVTDASATETITGSVASTLATETSSATETSDDEEASATETETESSSTSTSNVEAPNSAASVSRSSSLALALCVFAAAFYLN